jgi:uncharacterized membrane protein
MRFRRTRTFLRWLLGVVFVVAGIGHFVAPGIYLTIMPPALPWPLALIYISGVAEILGGLGVLLPVTRKLAGWGLIILLVAVFPANIYAAVHGVGTIPPWILWARLPWQIVFIAWVYWSSVSFVPARPATSAH